MSFGRDRYDLKIAAGYSPLRRDGSTRSADETELSALAEEWFARMYGGALVKPEATLEGDDGFDVLIPRRGQRLRVDVVHAGRLEDGSPREGLRSCLIVNQDSKKLVASDLLVYVEGLPPRFAVVGCIYTARFLAHANLIDHGFGRKFSLHATRLLDLETVLGLRRR
jgi:hypothetical protein